MTDDIKASEQKQIGEEAERAAFETAQAIAIEAGKRLTLEVGVAMLPPLSVGPK